MHQQEDEEQCSDGKRHVCPHPDCNVVCSKASKLKLHMLVHTGERPFKVSKKFLKKNKKSSILRFVNLAHHNKWSPSWISLIKLMPFFY